MTEDQTDMKWMKERVSGKKLHWKWCVFDDKNGMQWQRQLHNNSKWTVGTHMHTPMQTESLTACNFIQGTAYRILDFNSSVVAVFLAKANNFILFPSFVFSFFFSFSFSCCTVYCFIFRCFPFIFCRSFF